MKNLLPLLFILLVACAKPEYPRQGKLDYVSVGNFGGFSGLYTELQIFENGSMEYLSILLGDTSIKQLDPISKDKAVALIKDFKSLDVLKMDLNQSGNMNYFIDLQKGRRRNYIQWGDMPEGKISLELYELYESTFSLIPQAVNE